MHVFSQKWIVSATDYSALNFTDWGFTASCVPVMHLLITVLQCTATSSWTFLFPVCWATFVPPPSINVLFVAVWWWNKSWSLRSGWLPVLSGKCLVFCDNCSLFHFVYVRWRIQDLLHVENIVFHYYIITGCTIAATVNHSHGDRCNITQN